VNGALVSIIGPPAAGKTTLAENLCNLLPANLAREDYVNNPFLADSYVGSDAARLPAQLYFLVSRVSQLSHAKADGGILVSDYGWAQDLIFARLRLSCDDYRFYEPIAMRMAGLVRAPDVLVHLEADNSTLLNRLVMRGRDFERSMDESFLCSMRASYAKVAAEAKCPVISVDSTKLDLRRPTACSEIVQRIRAALPQKTG
jgi:deoxyguanosine kinase